MKEFSYREIVEVLQIMMKHDRLRNKVFVSGGIVPWLVSGRDSNRSHGDIDLIVSQENMSIIREILKEYNLYNQELDSLTYEQDGKLQDYGVDTYIRGIPVGFYPYERTKDGTLIQRSFSPNEINGKKDLKVKEIPDVMIEDYFTKTILPNGLSIGISTLEFVRATKEKANRQKDAYDIAEIDKIGINKSRYERVKSSINMMKSTLDDRKSERNTKKNLNSISPKVVLEDYEHEL